MKCPRCGARNRDDAVQCRSCGIWLGDVPETAEPSNKPLIIAMAVVLTALRREILRDTEDKIASEKET